MPEVEAMDVKGLCEIEHDPDDHSREYIPLPGGWEVQTKGRGSSYRLLDKKTGERHAIISGADWRGVQDFFTRFARQVFDASRDEQKQAATALTSLSRELAEARAERDEAHVAAIRWQEKHASLYLEHLDLQSTRLPLAVLDWKARALAAEAESLAKDERIRELREALAVFASGATVFYADEPDDCVLSLGRWKYQEDGRARFYADVQYTVADIRRARALAALHPHQPEAE